MKNTINHKSYWDNVRDRFKKHFLGMIAFLVIILFCLVGIYAPFLASSKPIAVYYDGTWYFPLFRYLFYTGFFTKKIDIFFNLLIFTIPLVIATLYIFKNNKKLKKMITSVICLSQVILFIIFATGVVKDPAADPELNKQRQIAVQKSIQENGHSLLPNWDQHLLYKNDYAKLNMLLKYIQRKEQHERLQHYEELFKESSMQKWISQSIANKRASYIRQGIPKNEIPDDATLKENILESVPAEIITTVSSMPTLHNINRTHRNKRLIQLDKTIERYEIEGNTNNHNYRNARARKKYITDRYNWIVSESNKISIRIMPLLRSFHWQDDAGGEQSLNKYISWWELTRINRKDMLAALIFGIRISLVVGITAVALSLFIGVPIGSFAGYYGGKFDIIVSRLLEIWESMPTFFMLLLVVAITQSKSIFLIVTVIGIFGWTSFSRYVRGEFFKQRNLSYVEACKASGFHDSYIIFTHILPNAVPPLLTLLPFAIMAAITSEAGLSFLGLGEEGSCSWGVLMDEGRTAFPGESYLLWPPAILLTTLLIAIALVGDALRDALDPKLLR
ncbi:MAG: ABC transporter permease [Chlamydiota bacterium]|nr:ABC transporter permease [Chlamydiota bacterium]